jgi:hypothetical protein
VSSAVALANIEIIDRDRMLRNVYDLEGHFETELSTTARRAAGWARSPPSWLDTEPTRRLSPSRRASPSFQRRGERSSFG